MTFQKLLNEYLCGARHLQSGYWQRYKHKAWRLFGVRVRGPSAVALREQVLARAEKRRMNPKVRRGLLVEEFLRRDYILSMVEKDTQWCGTMIVPFKAKEPFLPARFPESPTAPICDTYTMTHTQVVVKNHVYWKFGNGARISKKVNEAVDDFVNSMKDKIAEYFFGKPDE